MSIRTFDELTYNFLKDEKKDQKIARLEQLVFDLHRRIRLLEWKGDPGIECNTCSGTGNDHYAYNYAEKNCSTCGGKGRLYPEIAQ